jgi:hypothetical protein
MGGKSGKMAKNDKKERLPSKKYDDSFMSETDWLYMHATQGGSQKFNSGSSYSSYKAPANAAAESKSKMQRFGSAGSTGFTRDPILDTNEIVTNEKVA